MKCEAIKETQKVPPTPAKCSSISCVSYVGINFCPHSLIAMTLISPSQASGELNYALA